MSAEPQWLTDARALEAWDRALNQHMNKTGVTAMLRAWSDAHDREYHAFEKTTPPPTSTEQEPKRTAKGAR